MQWWIIGITCFSLLGDSIWLVKSSPVVASSFAGGNPLGSNRREQHAAFGEGIREWFGNLKNRLFGRSGDDQPSLPPPEAGRMMLELEDEDVRNKKENYPGGFFLDLSNLSFDPETDWGFHLGRWYFIKKSRGQNTDDWKSFQPDNSEWPTSGENTDPMEPPLITRKPDSDATTVETSTLPEEAPQVAGKKVEDNETQRPSDNNRSTEVLLPSE